MCFADGLTSAPFPMSAAPTSPLDPAALEWQLRMRTTLPVAVAAALLLLGLANIVQRATRDDVEDGVLWVQRSTGVVAAEVDQGSPAARAGVRAGDVVLAVDGQAIETREDVHAIQQTATPRHPPRLHAAHPRRSPRRPGHAGADPARRRQPVLRARRRRHLLVAGRGHGPHPPAGRRGHAPLLLARRRLLRRLHLLVLGPPRSRRLGVLLGRPGGDAAAAAAVLPFRAGLPRAAAQRAAGDARRQGLAAALPAADRPRCAAGQRAGPRLRGSRADDRHDRLAGSGRAALRGRLRGRRAGALRAGAAPRPLDHDAAAAPLDRVGHRDRRRAVRLRLRHPVRLRRRAVAGDGTDRRAARARAAGVRLGHRPLPADGRRGHPDSACWSTPRRSAPSSPSTP